MEVKAVNTTLPNLPNPGIVHVTSVVAGDFLYMDELRVLSRNSLAEFGGVFLGKLVQSDLLLITLLFKSPS